MQPLERGAFTTLILEIPAFCPKCPLEKLVHLCYLLACPAQKLTIGTELKTQEEATNQVMQGFASLQPKI